MTGRLAMLGIALTVGQALAQELQAGAWAREGVIVPC